MKIDLTEPEHALLVTLLQERQRELLHEISRAEVHNFRHGLQEREVLLETLLRKLESTVSANSAA